MKITLIQAGFLPVPPSQGGAVEKMWFELGAEFAARGHEVTQVSRLCEGMSADEQLRGVRHLRVRGAERPRRTSLAIVHDWFYARRAARVAPAADIVVTNSFCAPVLLKPRHGALYVDVQRMPKGQLKFYRRAARLRANSSAVASAILDQVPEWAERVRVIPNPLPFGEERPVDWSRKTKTILFAGRIHPEKGIELLLEAWFSRRKSGRLEGWRLELIGPVEASGGGGGEDWLKKVQARFASPEITWHPPIYDVARLNEFYERATVFAYPSLAVKGETFGLAVLEAMAWGAVPVVSGLACFRDFVGEGRNGFFFDHTSGLAAGALGGALERAAQPEARALAERAVQVRVSHSCSSIAAQFLEDFARLKP